MLPDDNQVSALRMALHGRYLRRSFRVSIIVGIVLNIINQGDALLAGQANIFKAILTFIVPFCVSTFASWKAILESDA